MTAVALRPLSVGEILDTAFQLYRRHFGTLAVIVIVCTGLPFLLQLYVEASGSTMVHPFLTAAYVILMVVGSSIATAATVFVVSESYLGRTIAAGEALGRSTPYLGRLIVSSLLFGLLVGLGVLLLVVPGIILTVGLALTWPALVLESAPSASAALERSWGLTKGYRWKIFGLLTVFFVLLLLPTLAIGGLVGLVTVFAGSRGSGSSPVAILVTQLMLVMLIRILIYPLYNCVLTVAYYDLRIRKEGFDLEVLASTIRAA
jgi:uncharacterized membrane protein